jgi:tRNA (uracil-5-)-methyltransferase
MGKRRKKNREIIETLAEKYRGSGVPRCSHFGECGGCMFQDISYDNQLALKTEYLNQTLPESLPRISSTHAAPSDYAYRNRMDFVCAFGSKGLRKRRSFRDVVDLHECFLLQEKSQKIWKSVREKTAIIEGYDYLSHNGFLRYIVMRQAAFTGETMVNFVLSRDDNREVIQSIVDDIPEIDSSTVLVNDTMTDLSFGNVIRDLKSGSINEDFAGTKFRIFPNTFFQSNSKVALQMYSEIKKNTYGRVLDLYCGVGSISLFVAENSESVKGVEIIEDSIASAKENAMINSIENAEFEVFDARFYLKGNYDSYETLILDPPRAGMNPKMYKYFHYFQPEQIIYMSCNPFTFANDYEFLSQYYALESFEAFDMFPQTSHIETLAVMKKRV